MALQVEQRVHGQPEGRLRRSIASTIISLGRSGESEYKGHLSAPYTKVHRMNRVTVDQNKSMMCILYYSVRLTQSYIYIIYIYIYI